MLFEIAFFTVAVLVKRANDYAKENERLANQLANDSADLEREYQQKARALQLQSSIQIKKENLYAAEQKIKLLREIADSWYHAYRQRQKDLRKIKKNLSKISAIAAKLHRNRRFFFIKKILGLVKMSRSDLDFNIQNMDFLVKKEKQRFQSCLSAMKREYAALKTANKKINGMKEFHRNIKRSINNTRQSASNVFRSPRRLPAPKTKQAELASEKKNRNASKPEYQLIWEPPIRTTMTLAEYKRAQKGTSSPRFRLKT